MFAPANGRQAGALLLAVVLVAIYFAFSDR